MQNAKYSFLTDAAAVLAVNSSADGWYKISPFGTFGNIVGEQHVTPDSGAQLAAAFNSSLRRVAAWVSGRKHTLPVYVGHPDCPYLTATPGHDDTTRYGEVTDVQSRPDGIYTRVAWNNAWEDIRGRQTWYFSPAWALRKNADGTLSPARLLSLGLTDDPNIPGALAVNSKTPEPSTEHPAPEPPNNTNTNMDKAALLALLVALGAEPFDVASGTDEEINKAISSAQAKLDAAQAEKTKADADLAKAQNDLGAVNSALRAATAATTAERTAHAKTILDGEVAKGTIAPCNRAAWNTRLVEAADFTLAVNDLRSQKTEMKTASELGKATAAHRAGPESASAAFNAKVAEKRKESGFADYTAAWNAVASTEEGKALIQKMEGK